MTIRRCVFLVVMTVMTLACAVPVAVMTAQPEPTRVMTVPPKPVMTTITAVMTASVAALEALHVRAEPGHDSLVVGYLYHGDQVTLTSQCSDDPKGWAQIEWNDGTAWVNARYLSDNLCKENEP